MTAKIGDIVRFLNDVGGGEVVRIEGNIAYVSDEDGFETPMQLRECVVVGTAKQAEAPKPEDKPVVAPKAPSKAVEPESEPIIETPEGDKINIVLAFEPADLLTLSQTSFDAFLVNDSNYFAYFTFMTRGENDNDWQTHFAGVVEPNYQLLVGEFTTADLPKIERIAVQIITFKRDKAFAMKAPIAYESRFEATKFARLHCFRENPYFDKPVIAYNIVTDDVPQSGATEIQTVESRIEVPKQVSRPVVRHDNQANTHRSKPAQKRQEPLVVDLHIGALIDNTSGLSNADILNYQIDKFREVMDANLRYGGKRIVFIHGKGEGVLRQALLKELNYRYKSCSAADASFREYGYGATQVTINAHKKS